MLHSLVLCRYHRLRETNPMSKLSCDRNKVAYAWKTWKSFKDLHNLVSSWIQTP